MPTELRYNKAELFISWHDYLLKIFNITELSTDELLMKYIILSEILDKVQKRDWVLGYNLLVRSFENHSVEDEIKKYKFLNKDMADAYGIALLGTSKGYRPSAFAELVYNIVDFLNDDGLERYYKICEKYIDGKYLETVLKRYLKTKFYETVYPICNWKDCSDELLHIITNYIGIKLNFAIYLDKYEQEPDVDTMINIITQFESAFYNQRMKIYEYYKNVKWDNYDKIKSLLLCWYK